MSDEAKGGGALRWCSCKASARDGQHMAWCPAVADAMSDDIVKRLREDYRRGELTFWRLLPEAADEIERLRVQIERLKETQRRLFDAQQSSGG